MDAFRQYLEGIEDDKHRAVTREVLEWVGKRFPRLVPRVAWNQPMFTDHGTFIIGFSVAKEHLSVSPERAGIIRFEEEIKKAGHECSKMLFRFRFDKPIDYPLLEKVIEFNISEKAGQTAFWRK
ncbi:MAG TPA: iron chaperone [Bacillota bacterium]|nr:iron chaperone [Bacillota bacterium]HOA15619.1 iron chaperone [Bacillota bacterium]HOG53473.1 iron chaperone [Bacillota bacterium]